MKLVENKKYTKDGREVREEHELNNWKNIRYYLKELESAIGHQDTATVLSNMLGKDIKPNRVNVQLQPDDSLIVAQLMGGRLPEGSTALPKGFLFKFFKVTVQA